MKFALNGDKLGGHAAQNWCLLRLLPLVVGDRIDDHLGDEVWLMYLDLKRIVEIVCAPKISIHQVAELQVLLEGYMQTRSETVFLMYP